MSLVRNRSYSVFLLVIFPSAGLVLALPSSAASTSCGDVEWRDGCHAVRFDVDAEWSAACHERGHESADVAVDVDPFTGAGFVRSDAADGGPGHRVPSGSSWLGSNARLVASMSIPDPSSPAPPLTMRRDPLRAWSRMFSECSLPLAWMVIFLVAVPRPWFQAASLPRFCFAVGC